jgi:hypothetical protein
MEQFLTFYAIVTGVNAAILWIAVKFIAPGCEKNSPQNALMFAATVYGVLLLPIVVLGPLWVLLGSVLALLVLISGLLMYYDLGVGQMFLVLIVMLSIRILAWGIMTDLAGIAPE